MAILIEEGEASEEVAVYADIKATRKTDWVNNFWKALANHPATLRRIWLKWIEIPKCVLDCDVSRKQDAPLTWGIRQSTRHGARQPSQSHSHRGESARRRVSATGQTWKDSKSGK